MVFNQVLENPPQIPIPIPSTLEYRPLPAPLETATNKTVPSLVRTVEAPGTAPCRKCLKDGKVGDKMRLLSYDPWLGDGPYRQSGPIFVHEEPTCEKAEFPTGSHMPEQQRMRPLSVRAFNQDHLMVGFDTISGEKLLERAEEFFKQRGEEYAEYVNVHYSGPGCFAVRIDRGEEA